MEFSSKIQSNPSFFKFHLSIMSVSKALLSFCLISCLTMASSSSRSLYSEEDPTAYEMLAKFNFPKGILPEGVKSYILNKDGSFEVSFDGDCKFSLEGGYSLNYRRKITGKVSFGSLKELQGVSVKVLFLWMGINEVSMGNGELAFYVGPLSASFPLSNFLESPRCGCGFDCKDRVSDA